MSTQQKGKFIVIEGTDGSGKGTQVALLSQKLKDDGIKFEITDFPQYGQPSSFFVEKYLRGEYGTIEEVGPHKASFFYGHNESTDPAQKLLHQDHTKLIFLMILSMLRHLLSFLRQRDFGFLRLKIR